MPTETEGKLRRRQDVLQVHAVHALLLQRKEHSTGSEIGPFLLLHVRLAGVEVVQLESVSQSSVIELN